jgi:hypothetical protein
MTTIPHNFLLNILEWAGKNNLQVLWDLHAFMGGSSNGTYSGVWPERPVFWTSNFAFGNTSQSLFEAGLWIAGALIAWVEKLDQLHLNATLGVSLMNEPAHLSVGRNWAQENQVLDWLSKAGDLFRRSSLPGKGVKLYVNIVDTAFHNWGAGFREVVPPWWRLTFSAEERRSWAVIDGHKYWAWDAQCAGCTGGGSLCAWECDSDLSWVQNKVRGCIDRWVDDFAAMFPDGLKAVSEFSAGTFRDGSMACTNSKVTHMYLLEQLEAFQAKALQPFFWTWRMPYGHPFEAGWSLKFLTGLEDPTPAYRCGAPLTSGARRAKQAGNRALSE